MPIFFQRPENALKRANEFIDVGKKQRALDALYDVIKSKKHRQWSKTHEAIMEKYLQLCVELKKSHVAKEGLYQYKNISQQVSIKSLEDVVRKYLALAEEKTESARKESHQTVVDVDDLDVIQTPEDLLLSAVSGEDTQDRTDRAILTPWVKFLWESYRQCLDLLRNDAGVEKLYQDIAQQAFKFCLKYARKTEFRKLCDNLRTHLSHIHKHQHKQRAINLNNPESQQLHLETRLVQLDSAIQMELWMEAFKAVEDIHGLIQQSKKSPKPSLMANYYNKLGLVFWKSGNHMFHACAWHRMYHLIKEQKKNLSAEELSKNSSRVLIATLAIPIPASRNHIDARMEMDESTLEKQRRLANLLGLKNPPTRASLIKDLVKFGIPQQCYEDLKPLYQSLEVEFHPLKLADRVAKPLEFIANHKDLKQYVSAIQDITITRLIKQISQVYQSIEFGRLCNLAPFTTPFRLESVVVSAAKNLELQVKIDHHTRSLSFGTDLCVAQKEDVPEGPYLQSMPSEQIRNQLTAMANSLSKAYKIIQPVDVKKTELQAHICQTYRQVARKEHERILQRRIIIENRKEELENLSNKREQEEAQLVEEERRRQYDAEMTRLEKEADERERQRRKAEHYEVQKKVAKERLEQLLSTELGKNAFEGMTEDDIVKMDVDDILAKQVEQLEKEKKEMQEKLKGQEKKIDHFERAKRLEEIPLLEEQFLQEKETEREIWVKMEDERIKTMKLERELALKHKDRMVRMMEDRDVFVKQLSDGRKSVFKEKVQDFEKKLKEEKKRRLEERKQKRKEDRRMKWIKDREEEEQRKKDEEAKRLREEEERAAQEKKEQEEAEYEERIQKLAEIEERKRAKEREIEEKAKLDKEAQRRKLREMDVRESGIRREDKSDWRRAGGGEDNTAPEKWRPSGGGGWRDREREKEKSWGKEGGGGGGWRERERERDADGPREDRRDERRDQEWSRDRRDGPGPRDRDIRRDRDMEDRRDQRRDGPPRDEPRGERDDWRRGGDSGGRDDRDWKKDDRPPARDDWRGGEKRGGGSDRRDDFQRDERKEEGAWRSSRDAGRDSDRGGWRDRGAHRDDRGGGGREERGGWRGDDTRGPPRERRDERRDDREGSGGGPSWRRPAGGDERKTDQGEWRKAPARKFEEEERRPAQPRPREDRPPPPKKEEVEGDGWTTVKRQ